MTIAVVGLGLIGGSLCLALRQHTQHTIVGIDSNPITIDYALRHSVIDRAISAEELRQADVTFLCLHPNATLSFARSSLSYFREGSIVADVCGVKKAVVSELEPLLERQGIRYVPTHPMAGREYSGIEYAQAEIFKGASFLIAKTQHTDISAIKAIEKLALTIGFGKVILSTPEEHDQIIAFTSQLAHIVSSAYIKSPTLLKEHGFSAGSFQDLTRVAKLNEDMWTSLFLMNREPLLYELTNIIEQLTQYRAAIVSNDVQTLKALLREGRIRKEKSLMEQ